MPRNSDNLTRCRVDTALAAGHVPQTRRTDRRTTVALGGIPLMINGELTAAGRHYEASTGRALTRPTDWQGAPFIVGKITFANIAGQRRKIETMVDGRPVVTNWGRRYFRENPIERVINVPIQITGTRRDGSTYKRARTTKPLTWSTNKHESDPDFVDEMLTYVHTIYPDVYTQSNEEVDVLYDAPPSAWTMSRRSVSIAADGTVRTRVTLDGPMRAPDGRHSFTSHPDRLVDEAFQDSKEGCVIFQLGARLGLSARELEAQFSETAFELYGEDLD